VAAFLQKPVSAIREMCEVGAQRGVHPLPFAKTQRQVTAIRQGESDALA
jgi:hypothetical protein